MTSGPGQPGASKSAFGGRAMTKPRHARRRLVWSGPMQRNISEHELRVFRAFTELPGAWLSARDITELAQVAPRTARGHIANMLRADIIDKAARGRRYRFAADAAQRNPDYHQQLVEAEQIIFDEDQR